MSFCDLTLHEAGNGHAGDAADHLGDVFLVDLFFKHLAIALEVVEQHGRDLDVALEFGGPPVAQLAGAGQVAGTLEVLGLNPGGLELLLEFPDRGDRVLLALPVGLHRDEVLIEVGEFLLERSEAVGRGTVGFLREGYPFDLELADAAIDLIDLLGHRVDLDAQLRTGFVHEVDGLVGQEPAGDVTIAQDAGRDKRGVLDAHAVVNLIALLEAAQDGDRVLDGRLLDQHRLEATLERGILLDVFAILVEGGGADHAKFAASEHRLEHVAGVHRTFGRAGADHGVHLVDEGDHLAVRLGDLLEHGLQAFLELTAVLRAGQHRRQVQGDDPLVLEAFGDVAFDDAPGQAFDDRRLADTGFADEDRVVLRAPAEDLDGAADLVVAADDGVELALGGDLGQVTAVLLERLVGRLGIFGGDPLAAANLGERGEQLLRLDAQAFVHGEQEMLGREVLVGQVLAGQVCVVEDARELFAHLRCVAAVGAGQGPKPILDLVAQRQGRNADPLQQRKH